MPTEKESWVFFLYRNGAEIAHLSYASEEYIRSPSLATETSETSTGTGSTTSGSHTLPLLNQRRPLYQDGGWTFRTSPSKMSKWSISSNVLLTVSYRAAHEAIPEFTQPRPTRTMRRTLKAAKQCHSAPPIAPQRTQIYTTADIVKIVHLPKVEIAGFSQPCKGLQLFLDRNDLGIMVDPKYEIAIDRHLQRAARGQRNRRTQQTQDDAPPPLWRTRRRESSDDAAAHDEPQTAHDGPVLTICLPPHNERLWKDCPPLLWKVELPPNPNLALDAVTVFDGTLDGFPSHHHHHHHHAHAHHPHAPEHHATNTTSAAAAYSSTGGSSGSDQNNNTVVPTNIYINGYQSWSYSGSVSKGHPQPKSAMPDVFSRAFNLGGKVPVAFTTSSPAAAAAAAAAVGGGGGNGATSHCSYQSDMYCAISSHPHHLHHHRHQYHATEMPKQHQQQFQQNHHPQQHHPQQSQMDEHGGPCLIMGWLSQDFQFGVVTADHELKRIRMHASADGVLNALGITTDWAFAQVVLPHAYEEEPMVHYLHAVAAYRQARPFRNGFLTGWCSWYHYYENISETKLTENLQHLDQMKQKVTPNTAIVDDGYMTAWGDWSSFKKKHFSIPHGLKNIATGMHEKKLKPGLWLAPFACDKKSKLSRKHRDWIIRNDTGRPSNSSNCGKFFLGLDATNPDVRDYAHAVVSKAVTEWGYNVLKLDFLYAACLEGNGKYDLTMTRAEAITMALSTLRLAAGPETYLIGCGCPIGAAVGVMDGMRISADTGPTWYAAFPLPWWDQATLPSLRSMIRNTVTRAFLGHRWWHNDPDCLLLGENTSLAEDEVVSAASIVAMTGGMMLISDDLTQLSTGRLRVLTKVYPSTGASAVALDLHSSNASGIPSLLRLWCSDRFDLGNDGLSASAADDNSVNVEGTLLALRASFAPDKPIPNPTERVRNCVHVAKGLGTWTIVSVSNWLDEPAVVKAPFASLLPPPESCFTSNNDNKKMPSASMTGPRKDTSNDNDDDGEDTGYHLFSFWSSKYIWVPSRGLSEHPGVSKKLFAHETEIYHLKAVTKDTAQYIGSDFHFSCGYEVREFVATDHSVEIRLKNDWQRVGYVYIYVPGVQREIVSRVSGHPGKHKVISKVPVNKRGKAACFGGRVVQVWITIHGLESENDGRITLSF